MRIAVQRARRLLLVAASTLLAATGVASASWPIGLAGSSAAEASAGAAPATPAGVTSACTSPTATTVKVSWSPVANATSYTIRQSTTSATSGYTTVATGITGATWTSASLATGTYWFEVSAAIGDNWLSASSSAAGQRTILVAACA